MKDLRFWDGVHELLVKKPSHGTARIPHPNGSRIRLDDELRGEESGYVEVQLLRNNGTVIKKVRFGFCPALVRLKTDIRWDGTGLLVARARSEIVVGLETGTILDIPKGESSLSVPMALVNGHEACAVRTLRGEWVYVRFEPWR